MSLSKLSKLPPEVLSCVLNNQAIPLGRRLHLRLLCNRWADIIEDALKKETSLMVRDEKAAYYRKPKPDDLIIKSTDQTDEFIRPLSRLFTSLTQLTLNFDVDATWKAVPSLLGHLNNTNLTTIKLYSSVYVDLQIELVAFAIADALTALSSLTSLTLRGHRFSDRLLPHLKPVLSRLEKFGCFDGRSAGILSSSLSPRCTHLSLYSTLFQSFNSSLLVELSRNLTHLRLFNCDSTVWPSLSQMHGLSSLTLDFDVNDLDSSIFSHLGPFTRLTQLKLSTLSYRTHLALPSKKETPLSSIKRLTLEVHFGYNNSPFDFQTFFSTISAWFPALLHLTIIIFKDTIPDIQVSKFSMLPFSVEIVDFNTVDTWSPDW